MQGPPYFDWRLDRWKIGLALLLWLGLFVFLPAQPPVLDPQGASLIARPGQRPVVGSSGQTVAEAPVIITAEAVEPPVSPLVRPLPNGGATLPPPSVESPIPTATPSQLMILEPGPEPLTNSMPLFFGQVEPDGRVEILVAGRRFAALADGEGYWQFAPSTPLPVGMTWVQVQAVDVSGNALSPTVSRMALVGASAQAISPPLILTPLPFAGKLDDSTPYFTGRGPAGRWLVVFAKTQAADLPGENGKPLGEAVVGVDGGWGWQMTTPLPSGQTTLWVVVVDDAGTPLSRSWPVTLDVAENAAPSVADGTTR